MFMGMKRSERQQCKEKLLKKGLFKELKNLFYNKMKLINQHTKKIMEDCKVKAKAAGLKFSNESLEYIATNKDLIKLSPKHGIPTLYDYWVHDINTLYEEGEY